MILSEAVIIIPGMTSMVFVCRLYDDRPGSIILVVYVHCILQNTNGFHSLVNNNDCTNADKG